MNPARILVAEDDEITSHMLRYVLERAGFEVVVADDGEAAWRRLEGEPFDLLITDFQMPGLNGAELCSLVIGDPRFGTMPIVLLTAKAYEEDVLGMNDAEMPRAVVSKPFSSSELIRLVRRCLEAGEPTRAVSDER
jgi:CheY-like chemotaxis protein